MGKPRTFSTAAVSAMRDPELTGLDWRVYLWVSIHDGMSLVKGKGMGCIASNKTLFAEVGCDYSSGCRSLSKLVDAGHLVREKLGRATRYRVTFPDPDNLQAGNISTPEIGGEPAIEDGAIGCRDNFETRRNPPETTSEYILRSSKIDSSEEGIKNSIEMAHLGDAQIPPDDLAGVLEGIFPTSRERKGGGKKDTAEAGLGSVQPFSATLPKNFPRLPLAAQVSRLDQAYTAFGRDPDKLGSRERAALTEWLGEIFDEHMGGEMDATAQQAARLREDMIAW